MSALRGCGGNGLHESEELLADLLVWDRIVEANQIDSLRLAHHLASLPLLNSEHSLIGTNSAEEICDRDTENVGHIR